MPKAAALNFSNPPIKKGRKGEDKSPSPKQKAGRPDRQGRNGSISDGFSGPVSYLTP